MKKLFEFLDSTLKSVRFTVVLMLGIGAASIYGTIFPAKTPFEFNLYKTPAFIALLFVFALNIAYCTFGRLLKQTKTRGEKKPIGQEICRLSCTVEDAAEKFKNRGFAVETTQEGFTASKGRYKSVIVLIIHAASVFLLISAGLSSATGFLGTSNVHVNDKLSACFDWRKKTDVPLPFDIYVDGAFTDYYPMPIKVELENAVTGMKKLVVTKENETIDFESLKIKILKADPPSRTVLFGVIKDGREHGPYENITTAENFSLSIKLMAFIDPLPKQYYTDVAVFENSVQQTRKRVSINDPLFYKGYRIYLVETGKDSYGFDYVGFQITKEPLINAIWFFSVLLCAALAAYPFMRKYYIRVIQEDGTLIVFAAPAGVTEEEIRKILL